MAETIQAYATEQHTSASGLPVPFLKIYNSGRGWIFAEGYLIPDSELPAS